MKNLRIGIFAVVMLLYIWFPFNMIRQTEQVLKHGNVYHFQLQPIDPYDAFRGRYVSLFYGNQEIPSSDSLLSGQEVYITLQRDSLGFANFKNIYTEKPTQQDYLTTNVLYFNNGLVTIEIPENMAYYYMNEQSAPEVEKLVMFPMPSDSLQEIRSSADIRILNGNAVVEELYINDLPVKTYLKQQ